jgi:hypothetical protein
VIPQGRRRLYRHDDPEPAAIRISLIDSREEVSEVIAKSAVHQYVIEAEGGAGSVWKKLDRPYEPAKRVRHRLKRKTAVTVEAVVTECKPDTSGKGHGHLVGAVEFSVHLPAGTASWSRNRWSGRTSMGVGVSGQSTSTRGVTTVPDRC